MMQMIFSGARPEVKKARPGGRQNRRDERGAMAAALLQGGLEASVAVSEADWQLAAHAGLIQTADSDIAFAAGLDSYIIKKTWRTGDG